MPPHRTARHLDHRATTDRDASIWIATTAAAILRHTSAWLARAARRLAAAAERHRRRTPPPVLEFHAEAGAPEGALYVDGRLIGTIVGIRRL